MTKYSRGEKYSDNKYGALDFKCYIVVLHNQSAFIKRVVDYCITNAHFDIIHISHGFEGDIQEYQPLGDAKAQACHVSQCRLSMRG